jgi:hypothetical protein
MKRTLKCEADYFLLAQKSDLPLFLRPVPAAYLLRARTVLLGEQPVKRAGFQVRVIHITASQ